MNLVSSCNVPSRAQPQAPCWFSELALLKIKLKSAINTHHLEKHKELLEEVESCALH